MPASISIGGKCSTGGVCTFVLPAICRLVDGQATLVNPVVEWDGATSSTVAYLDQSGDLVTGSIGAPCSLESADCDSTSNMTIQALNSGDSLSLAANSCNTISITVQAGSADVQGVTLIAGMSISQCSPCPTTNGIANPVVVENISDGGRVIVVKSSVS